MQKQLILSLISDDKPGIVEAIAKVVAEHNGNWLESQLAHLAGKFAGVVQIQVAQNNENALIEGLNALEERHIRVFIDDAESVGEQSNGNSTLFFHALGPDRPGIVREVSHTFSQYGINVEKLDTKLSSMPYSGDPLFEAEGKISLPENLNLSEFEDQLDEIANQLAMDISLKNEED